VKKLPKNGGGVKHTGKKISLFGPRKGENLGGTEVVLFLGQVEHFHRRKRLIKEVNSRKKGAHKRAPLLGEEKSDREVGPL